MCIRLETMTRERMHEFYRSFEYDTAISPKNSLYVYNAEKVDQLYMKHMQQGKIHFAIILEDFVIGDIYLKHIDRISHSCELGIHTTNDVYKGKGYGTQAIQLILEYAFTKLKMNTVNANTFIDNNRSKRALIKAGFTEIAQWDGFCHFECRKSDYKCLD